ncbi:MAG: hypothetical protein AB1726_17670 [Planctomycetota bacterium]
MRKLLLLLLLFLSLALLGALADAQILVVRFKSEKIAGRYKKHTTPYQGEMVILGEPVPDGGVVITATNIQYRGANPDPRAEDQNEFFVLDPKNPEAVPYEIEDGVKVPVSRKTVVAVPGGDIGSLAFFMRSEDIQSLAGEYRFRRERLDRRREERDAAEKGSAAWFEKHRLLILECERLRSWLEQISFFAAAEKLAKELDKERKISTSEALDARWKRAIGSVHAVETFAPLGAASQAITGGAAKFSIQESQHVRFIYLDEIGHARVKKLLELAEELIEGFRVEFVDPYLAADFEDRVPDGLFLEFMFCRDDPTEHRRFAEEFYQHRVTQPERVAELAGMTIHRPLLPQTVNLWRYSRERDMEGIVTHNVGHALACLHFNGGPMGMNQPWIEEGLGYYLSFEYTGRNSVVCKEFREANYVRPAGKEGEKGLFGLRDLYNRTALERGQPLDKMALLYLYDLEDGDLAKSWSIFDWVAKELGKPGQQWLRNGCAFARDRNTFLAEWRPVSEGIFGVTSAEDVYKVIDDRWRRYAETQQDTSQTLRQPRKR